MGDFQGILTLSMAVDMAFEELLPAYARTRAAYQLVFCMALLKCVFQGRAMS